MTIIRTAKAADAAGISSIKTETGFVTITSEMAAVLAMAVVMEGELAEEETVKAKYGNDPKKLSMAGMPWKAFSI